MNPPIPRCPLFTQRWDDGGDRRSRSADPCVHGESAGGRGSRSDGSSRLGGRHALWWNPDVDEAEPRKKAEAFVTDPGSSRRIPPHATGGAVDLTLADAHGRELDMGTPYDHFGPEPAALYFEDNAQNTAARNNRRILRDAMTGAAFDTTPMNGGTSFSATRPGLRTTARRSPVMARSMSSTRKRPLSCGHLLIPCPYARDGRLATAIMPNFPTDLHQL
ncbi:M15 family metallopeptidase [Nonomuraea sp. CA-141351]|uniref:M15 family metallopeptidase n=1 Tax=Nonomuraea sp. CA-141351 TaxID=3239996 RepID=UPI003D938D56